VLRSLIGVRTFVGRSADFCLTGFKSVT
jgi:hypothetical protein